MNYAFEILRSPAQILKWVKVVFIYSQDAHWIPFAKSLGPLPQFIPMSTESPQTFLIPPPYLCNFFRGCSRLPTPLVNERKINKK